MRCKSSWRRVAVTTMALSALAVTGCASQGAGAGDEGQMTFVGAGGIYQEAQTESMITPFEEETGIKVAQESPLNYAKLKAMVDAGNVTWDVMEAYPYFSLQNCEEYLEPLDYDVIDTSEIDEDLVLPCAVPAMKSALVLVYNADTYTDEVPTSWEDFFDLEKFPGTRGLMNDVNQGALEVALTADGVAPDDLYPLDMDRAFAKLDTLGDNIEFIATGADQEQALQNGTVDMMLAWPGRAMYASENGANLKPVWNQPIFYNNAWVIPKGAPNKDEAMKFLNFALQAEPQAGMSEGSGYVSINNASEPDLTDGQREWMPTGQDDGTGFWRDENWWAENLDDATSRWTSWAAG